MRLSKCSIIDFKLLNLIDASQTQFDDRQMCKAVLKSGKKAGQQCGGKAKPGIEYCGRHIEKTEVKPVVKEKKKKQKKVLNVKKLCLNMISLLNSETSITDVDVIIIERQPPRNKKMGEISHYLYMYLQCRLLGEGKEKIPLMYLSATNRMNKMCEVFSGCVKYKKNNTHYNRKQNAIHLVQYILDNYLKDEGSQKIKQLRKKDDVSDCLLQVLWFLIKNKSIVIMRK